jgi:hypothetical protein
MPTLKIEKVNVLIEEGAWMAGAEGKSTKYLYALFILSYFRFN